MEMLNAKLLSSRMLSLRHKKVARGLLLTPLAFSVFIKFLGLRCCFAHRDETEM